MMRSTIRWWVSPVVVAMALALSAKPAIGQSVLRDTSLQGANKRTYSPTSFEVINVANGRISLSNTDLALPAGAGIPLEFGWTISGLTGEYELGLRGLVTEVIPGVCSEDTFPHWDGRVCQVVEKFSASSSGVLM